MWQLQGPGIKPVSPALAGVALATGPPGGPSAWLSSSSLRVFLACFVTFLMVSTSSELDLSAWLFRVQPLFMALDLQPNFWK